jgi:hypothetical protein
VVWENSLRRIDLQCGCPATRVFIPVTASWRITHIIVCHSRHHGVPDGVCEERKRNTPMLLQKKKTLKVLVVLANSYSLFEHVQFLRLSGKFFGGSNTRVMGPFNLVDDIQ